MACFVRILPLIGLALLPYMADAQTIVPIGSGFNGPDGLAIDGSGNVFVADSGNHVVREALAAGGYTTIRTFGNGLVLPQGTAVDSQGNIFVADPTAKIVREVLAEGGYTTGRTIGTNFYMPTGVAVDANDNVFVVDGTGVWEVLAAGGYTNVKQIDQGYPASGYGVAVDANDNVYTAGGDGVQEYLAASGYQTVETLGYGFDQPYAVAVDGSGNVYVADSGSNAVKKIPANGGPIPTVETIASGFKNPSGIAIDSDGNLFIGDQGNGAVKEILAAGGYTMVQTLGSGFTRPVGVAVGPGGNLFVADAGTDTIQEIEAAGGYTTTRALSYGFVAPGGLAIDGQGNLFLTDRSATFPNGNGAIKEIPAAGGYAGVLVLNASLAGPGAIAVDGADNLFVTDSNGETVKEILATGGYSTVNILLEPPSGPDVFEPNGVAVDAGGNVFVTIGSVFLGSRYPIIDAVEEILAVDGSIPASPTVVTLSTGFALPDGIALDSSGNLYISDAGAGTVSELPAAGGYATVKNLAGGFSNPLGLAVAGNGDVFVSDSGNNAVKEIFSQQPSPLFAAVLPSSRSVEIGTPATVFASMINSGTDALDNCRIALTASAPAGLVLSYQTSDPTTNTLTGTPNTPVTLAGDDGLQTFLITFTGTEAFNAPAMPLSFSCDGAAPASIIAGVDTIDLTLSETPVPDIIALAATLSNNGTIEVPQGAAAAFAVATSNLGADSPIIASVDTGTVNLPASVTICQSDPSNGACLGTAAPTVSLDIASGATPTFSVFVGANAAIPFAPASSRIFVRFMDDAGNLHGSTSVAIETVN